MYKYIRQLIHDLPLLVNRVWRYQTDQDYVPSSALAIAAHPDDIEFFFAGTLARWAQHGTDILYIVCTSGEAGFEDQNDIEKNRFIRESEQLAAAEVLGVEEVVFLRHMDGLLEDSIELRRRLVREMRLLRPEVVIILDPSIYFGSDYVNHPDHRAAGSAGLAAVYPLSGSPLIFQELEADGIQAYQVPKLFIHTFIKPNLWVDITETIDIKLAALKKHVSQIGSSDHTGEVRAAAARSARFTPAKYAETFRAFNL